MKKLLSFIVILCMIMSMLPGMNLAVSAATYSGTYGDNLTWKLSSGTLTISGEGEMQEGYDYPWLDYEYMDEIKKVVIKDGVTNIGDAAFYYCENLTKVTIADSVLVIGSEAFSDCYNLKDVSLGENLQSIKDGAFSCCESLTKLEIPKNVCEIETAFEGAGLTKITVDEENEYYTSIDGNLFNKDATEIVLYAGGKKDESYTIPDGVKRIGNCAFSAAVNLKSVIIPEGVITIGEGAFSFTNISSISLPDSVTTIENDAFNDGYFGADALTDIKFGEGVSEIGEWAFWGCGGLTEIIIPNKLKEIKSTAFAECTSLTSVVIPEGVEKISDYAFGFDWKLMSVAIPKSVTEISKMAFWSCNGLTEFVVSEDNAYYCSKDGVLMNKNMTTLIQYPAKKTEAVYVIPGSVTSIGDAAFSDCNSLTSITIPISVTSIGSGAFSSCSNLTDVYYFGSEEEWNNVSIDWDNTCLTDATIHYNYVSEEETGEIAGGTCGDNLTWVLDNDGVLTISGTGGMTWIGSFEAQPWYDYAEKIEKIVIEEGVTSVQGNAFGFTNVKEIIIPSTVTNFFMYAAHYCDKLVNIQVAEGNTRYYTVDGHLFDKSMESLVQYCAGKTDTSYTIPDGIVRLEDESFAFASYLQEIHIPKSVKQIGMNVFNSCSALGYIYYRGTESQWKNNVTVGSNNSWYNEINIHFRGSAGYVDTLSGELGENLTWTYNNGTLTISGLGEMITFSDGLAPWEEVKDEITTLIIENGVITVSYEAFGFDYAKLENIQIADSVETIGENAFTNTAYYNNLNNWEGDVLYLGNHLIAAMSSISGCYEVKEGTISIAPWVFAWCEGLEEVKLPESVKSIGYYAFAGCENLKRINIPDGVTSIGWRTFAACGLLENIDLPESVVSIEQEAFAGCNSITEFTIPDSVTHIGSDAFMGCGFAKIEIPEGVETIAQSSFSNCENLEEVKIPKSVLTIEEYAFGSCDKLTDIYYAGSEEEWKNVVISDYNENLLSVNMHFSKEVKDPEIKCELQDNTLVVTAENVSEENKVFAVTFSNGQAQVNKLELTDGTAVMNVEENVEIIKVFVWESFESMKPLGEVQKIIK